MMLHLRGPGTETYQAFAALHMQPDHIACCALNPRTSSAVLVEDTFGPWKYHAGTSKLGAYCCSLSSYATACLWRTGTLCGA